MYSSHDACRGRSSRHWLISAWYFIIRSILYWNPRPSCALSVSHISMRNQEIDKPLVRLPRLRPHWYGIVVFRSPLSRRALHKTFGGELDSAANERLRRYQCHCFRPEAEAALRRTMHASLSIFTGYNNARQSHGASVGLYIGYIYLLHVRR